MSFHKVWLITQREFLYNLMRPSYLLTAFVIPLVIAGFTYLAMEVVFKTELNIEKFKQVGYVDEEGVLVHPVGEDYARYVPYPDEATALEAIQAKKIQAYLLLPANYMQTGQINFVSPEGLPGELRDQIRQFLVAGLAASHPEQPILSRAAEPLDEEIRVLGEDDTLSLTAAIVRFAAPLIFGFLLIFNVITSSQFLMSGVVEEKENFIMEILATSVRPVELITGKVWGLGGLALLQMLFWMVLGLGMGIVTGRLSVLSEARFDPLVIAVSLLFFFLFFIMFSGIMIGIGAAVTAEQEARQFASIFTVLAILPPSWGMVILMESPNSPLSVFLSLFPLTSPLTMILLLGIGKVALWQVVASLTILVLTISFVLWFSARVFRAGMLNTGQRLSFKQLVNLVRG